jgi:hypothetical protein
MKAPQETERRTGPRAERFDSRAERARPSKDTALAHGMSLTIAHGDMAARELTAEDHAWLGRFSRPGHFVLSLAFGGEAESDEIAEDVAGARETLEILADCESVSDRTLLRVSAAVENLITRVERGA